MADSGAAPPRHVLIDAGDDAEAARGLREAGIRSLDLLVLTHAHHDHYGGMDEVLDAVRVRAFAFNGQVRSAATYRRLLARVEREVPVVIVVDSVRRVRLGEGERATTLTLIPPLPTFLGEDTDQGERLNEGSLAVRVEHRGFSFLTTGDAEHAANRRFATMFPALVDVDVLKLGHHGSTDATDRAWLAATSPEAAIVSANGTTHPHAVVLALLKEHGIPLYCTPQHGAVRVRVAPDGTYRITRELQAGRECAPGRSR
ncbi:MAG TPA: MBL fold metallo-hydrolase [Longimicrobiales bacterium]